MIVGRGSGIISTLRANAGILRRKSSFRDIRHACIKDIEMNSDKLDAQSLEDFHKRYKQQQRKDAIRSLFFLLTAIIVITFITDLLIPNKLFLNCCSMCYSWAGYLYRNKWQGWHQSYQLMQRLCFNQKSNNISS